MDNASGNPHPQSENALDHVSEQLSRLDTNSDKYAVEAVDVLLAQAQACGASDLHLIPNAEKRLDVLMRIDGLLRPVTTLAHGATNIVSRLKVLANLLTYRTDIPQEGRIHGRGTEIEMRVSSFPTVHGEKAVVRLFVGSGQFQQLDELDFPGDVIDQCRVWMTQPQGVLIVSGPAGAGKTTTLYALLRQILRSAVTLRSICTLEDPIEALVPGTSQSQIHPQAGFTYEVGLKSLLRQDPEVLMVGEIRDKSTAEVVFQASLTGHLVLTTFHAGRAAEACGRLLDMGIEPYVIKSGLLGILSQRLVRRLCGCRREVAGTELLPGPPVARQLERAGCELCSQTGYRGRVPLVEAFSPQFAEVGQALLRHAEVQTIEDAAISRGMTSLRQRANDAVESGVTSMEEVIRVFGVGVM